MGIEFELKYRATPESLKALDEAYSGKRQIFSMETTYYDTPAGDLSARKYTLRRRMENGISVCTLKTPEGKLGRGEFEVHCDSIAEAFPELCKLSGHQELAALTQAGLIAVCGARFQRIAKTLTLPGCTAELALDCGVLTGGSREIPLCEAEVELKSGSREVMAAFASSLSRVFGLEPEHRSKFHRALSLAKGEHKWHS